MGRRLGDIGGDSRCRGVLAPSTAPVDDTWGMGCRTIIVFWARLVQEFGQLFNLRLGPGTH